MVDFPHKIVIPQRSAHCISRSRLNELLSTITDRRLITLSGPAGYGKTSLLIDFAHSAPLPVCWYTIDAYDQDPWVFLEYFVASIEYRFLEATKQTRTLLEGDNRTSFGTVIDSLARDIYTLRHHFVIILDDWDLVDEVSDISAAISLLLLRCPNCHFILASRTYPSLQNMMLLAARREMSSFDERQLRFTAEEVGVALQIYNQTAVSVDQATALTERLNGWITGVLLSFQTSGPFAEAPISLSFGAERQIYLFLVEQVFNQQPPNVRSFLLDAALLEELTPETCDAIFHRSDSRQLLELLLRRHLFISEIRPGVLRYHPQFREFLQQHYRTIDPERHARVAIQIADFYAGQSQWMLAFEHYMAAGRRDMARKIIASAGQQLFVAGRIETIEHWFNVIPAAELDAPLLCLKARICVQRGARQEAQQLAQAAELRMQPGDEATVMLLHTYLARLAGHYDLALDLAQRVLAITEEPDQRATAIRTIGICYHRLGQTERAIVTLNEALALERKLGHMHAIAELQRDLGICHRDAGHLQTAEDNHSQADMHWSVIGNLGMRASTLNSKAIVQHLAGHYQDAYNTLRTALQYAREASVPDYEAMILSSLGDLYCDLQFWDEAETAYSDARKCGGSAYLVMCLDLTDIRLLLRQRKFEAAARALRQLPASTVRLHSSTVLMLRSGLACGLGDYDQAMRDARAAVDALEQSGLLIDLARAYVLLAQITAEVAPSDHTALIALLEQAVQIADQLGHDAFLVAETQHMRSVLRRAAANGWARAENWLQRQYDMLLVAQGLVQNDQRLLVTVRTLNVDLISFNGQPVDLGWQKAREVLYYLLAHPDGETIDALREAIWPDLKIERSRDALRSAIYQLREALPREFIELHGRQIYRLNRNVVRLDYDVERFLQILDTRPDDLEALSEAIDMYHGPYLVSTDNHWCAALRSHLELRYLHALHLMASRYMEKQIFAEALTFYQRILSVDALDEAAHAGVMRCQIGLSNRAAAISQYQKLRHILDEELGLDPGSSSEIEQLYRSIIDAD